MADQSNMRVFVGGAAPALAARALVLPVSAVSGIFAARIVTGALGPGGFATYALVVGLASLIPFADLGVSAAVTDVVARRKEVGQEHVQRTLITSVRLLAASGVVVATSGGVIAILGIWPRLLGLPGQSDVNAAAAAGLTWVSLGIVLGVSWRVLLGLHLTHVITLLHGCTSMLTLVALFASTRGGSPLWLLASAPFASAFAVSLVAMNISGRRLGVHWPSIFRKAARFGVRGTSVRKMAVPMLVITVSLPIALQSDRLVLSWFSTQSELARYSFVAPLFAALFTLVSVAGMTLWPRFAERRADNPVGARSLGQLVLLFGVSGVLLGAALVALGPSAAAFMSIGQTQVPRTVFLAFALLMIVQGGWIPVGDVPNGRERHAIPGMACRPDGCPQHHALYRLGATVWRIGTAACVGHRGALHATRARLATSPALIDSRNQAAVDVMTPIAIVRPQGTCLACVDSGALDRQNGASVQRWPSTFKPSICNGTRLRWL